MSYLVTRSGRTFRLLGKGSVTDATGHKLATLITYEGDSREVVGATDAAAELIGAMGLELRTAGEQDVVVQALVGYAPKRMFQTWIAFHVTFELRGGLWVQLPGTQGRPPTIGSGPLEVSDDPEFPLDGKGLDEAGELAGRWETTLNAGDSSETLGCMCEKFATESSARWTDWKEFVEKRGPNRLSARSDELYRMQTRNSGVELPGGAGVLVLFDVRHAKGNGSIDQVALARESGRWCVWSFTSLTDSVAPPD